MYENWAHVEKAKISKGQILYITYAILSHRDHYVIQYDQKIKTCKNWSNLQKFAKSQSVKISSQKFWNNIIEFLEFGVFHKLIIDHLTFGT